jgi:hypothetical protein
MWKWRYSFIYLQLGTGWWSASRLCHFTLGETDPSTHWIGGWVGPRAGLDAVKNREILLPPQAKISQTYKTSNNYITTFGIKQVDESFVWLNTEVLL